jgi:PucR-like helix-turn-helix protein/purine catabolism regulatory family protein/diguanylate cyclase with GGDEF domain
MSTPTVRMLAEDPALGLRLLAGAGAADCAVAGAHTTDLDQPARYLLPGELVLTNGLWTEHVDGATWANDVATAGAAAIGFGLADHHPEVPADLCAACEELGLPLLEVPEDLSFSMIAAAAADDASGLRLQLSRTRRLLQRLGAGGGHAALLDFLRRETRLAVWLVGPGGRPLDGCDPVADPDLARAAARAARRGELPAAIGDDACAFGAAPVLAARTAVLVGAPLADIGDDARLVIEQVTAYVVLEDARARAQEEGRRTLAAELVELAWSGDLGTATLAARLRALGFAPGRPLTVVASGNEERDVTYAGLGCGETSVSAPYRETVVLLVESDADDVAERLADLIADGGDDPVIGAGRPIDPGDPAALRQSLAEAVTALALARTRPAGQRVVRHLDIGSHALLLDFVDRQVLLAFRESVLGSLERWDGTDLVRTLQAFLANDGQWRVTAAQLHIHHNTLRYRIGRIATITGRDPETTAGRVDFALALAIPPG